MNVIVLLSFCCPFACFVSLILRFCWILVLRSLCVNVLFSSVTVFCSFSGLLLFHNFHRLLQCCALVIRMCTICITRFLICVYSLASQRLTITFSVSQSRLDSRISDQDINIPNYCISRKDSIVIRQTGIAVYIHYSIADITHGHQDLESDLVECIWLELKPSTNAPNIFCVFFFIQKPFRFLWMVWQLCTSDWWHPYCQTPCWYSCSGRF